MIKSEGAARHGFQSFHVVFPLTSNSMKTVKAYWKISHLSKPITLQEQAGLQFAGYDSLSEQVEWIGDESDWKRYEELLQEQI